jgi:pimeloyl-ACP methyl ester carboxylesterase
MFERTSRVQRLARSTVCSEKGERHMDLTTVFMGLLIAPVPASYLVEALRRSPAAPERLDWQPEIPIRYVRLDGTTIRYITAGSGRPLVLLHPLRTQLDMFQKVLPELARYFQVYALDYPGHGYSDIPDVTYSADFFLTAVAQFLDRLDIRDAVVAGESIGGSIALQLAARRNSRVQSVVAINPYDYDAGRGLRRSSALANLLFGLNNVPVVGGTVMRLRQFPVMKRILEGGVYRKEALPPALARELYQVGNRPGHYRAFMSLVRHWPDWERGRAEYGKIDRPTLLLYGDHDWSRVEERDANQRDIPGVQRQTIRDGGHFLSLDAPSDVVRAIVEFTGRHMNRTGDRAFADNSDSPETSIGRSST